MKARSTLAAGIFALSMGQAAFGNDIIRSAFATVTSPFITTTGLGGTSTVADMEKAQKLGLDEADVDAIRHGRMTSSVREMARDSNRSEQETLRILQDEFGIAQ